MWKILIWSSVLLVILLILIVLLDFRSPTSSILKLADCESSNFHFNQKIPQGGYFRFVLGVPRSSPSPVEFKGKIVIKEEATEIKNLLISSDDTSECNWIADPNIQGHILRWNLTPEHGVEDYLQPGNTYDFYVEFSQMPPQGSSLWLAWVHE
jgi:hypothetical protein